MAATQISDDLLEDHVKVGIEKWQKGELFMSIGVSESDPILEPGASLPDKNDKKHPFHKFLEAVASDITQGFALDRNEKKSILRRLQDKSEKWKELVASKSEQIKTTPTPKKKKNKKEDTPMDDPLEESSSSQTVGEQSQLAEAATPAAAKKMLDTNLERKKRIFEEARDMIMADVPDSTKESFGQIYFSKWGKQFLPCLVMNPYSVPPGGVRDMWLDMYDKVKAANRLAFMTNLVYWYGSSADPANAYSFVPSNKLTSYEAGVKKGLAKIPAATQKKLDEGKPVPGNLKLLVEGLKEMAGDLEKDPKDRHGYMESDFIEAYAMTSDEEDNSLDLGAPPIATKKGKGKTKVKEEKEPTKKAGWKKRKKAEEEPVEEEITPNLPKKAKKGGKKTKKTDEKESSEIKTGSMAVEEEEPAMKSEENPIDAAQDQVETIDDVNAPSPRDPDEDYKFAMGDSGSEDDSDDEDFNAERVPSGDGSGRVKSKPLRSSSKSQKEAPKKKPTTMKHKIDKTVEKVKKAPSEKKRKIAEFKKCKESSDEFQPLFNLWKVALDASDIDGLVKVLTELLPLVQRIHWALLPLVITQLLNPAKKVLPDDRKEEYKQLKNALKSHYEATLQDRVPGFEMKKLFTEETLPPSKPEPTVVKQEGSKNQEIPTTAATGPPKAPLASPIQRIGSLEKVVESSSDCAIPLQKEVKVERKKFSLGKLMRPTETTKNVTKSASSEKLSTSIPSAKKQQMIPDWITGKLPIEAPTDETRSFALEFLRQAAPFIPHNHEVNHDAIAIALEAAIYRKYALGSEADDSSSKPKPEIEWVDDYWKKVDDIVVALSGDKRNGTISTLIAQGKFQSPDKVVQLSDEAIYDSFSGKPVFMSL